MQFIHDITCTIYYISSTVYDITFRFCVTSHNACISEITHSMFMSYLRSVASYTVLWQHNHCVTSQPLCLTSHPLYLCHLTQFINIIKPSVCMTLQQLYVWHHMHYIWCHAHMMLCVWQHKLYIWLETHSVCHHIHCICHHTHSVKDITTTM